MQVKLFKNPKYQTGLCVQFPYSPRDVETIKEVLGFNWDKSTKTWGSQGPECLLDMYRLGIGVEWASKEAMDIAQEFRQQIWDTMDCRSLPIDDEPYSYQKQGSKYLSILPTAILADDLGTGKTKQALDAALIVGVQEGVFRRIPKNSGDESSSYSQFEEPGKHKESQTISSENLPERRTKTENIQNNQGENASTSGTRETPELSEERKEQSDIQIQREWLSTKPIYSEDGEYSGAERLHKGIRDKDKRSQYGIESTVQLQSGFWQPIKDDSNRIRQESDSYNNQERIRQEEVYRSRGFRLESVQNKTYRILVICPKTLTYNWLAEVIKWYPELSAGIVPDNKRTIRKRNGNIEIGTDEFWEEPPKVVISNYEKLLTVGWPYQLKWDVLICDEATRLKNSQTQTYKNVRKIKNRSIRTWCLTGTPLEIRLIELYNILSLLRPSVLGNFYRFRAEHLECDWMGTVVGSKRLDLLRERIAPFILRRTKQEVLRQLPDKVYQNIFVKLNNKEIAAYQAMTSAFNNWLAEHSVSGAGDPLVELLRMRQFCATPALFTDELGRGSKFEALQEIIEEYPGRIVIFCFFEQVVELLHKWLNTPVEAVISGKVAANLRVPRINAFNEGRLGKVLVSTDAGGMGLNITGADMIIHYDQLWNPQRMKQREDRLHRIGQKNNVTVINMLCMDTIDWGMYCLNREREQLFKDVVDGAEEAILRKLDAPRLKRLVEGRL